MQGGSRGLTTGWTVLQPAWKVPASYQLRWTACWQPSRRGLPLKPPPLSNDWLWSSVQVCSRRRGPNMRLVSFSFIRVCKMSLADMITWGCSCCLVRGQQDLSNQHLFTTLYSTNSPLPTFGSASNLSMMPCAHLGLFGAVPKSLLSCSCWQEFSSSAQVQTVATHVDELTACCGAMLVTTT